MLAKVGHQAREADEGGDDRVEVARRPSADPAEDLGEAQAGDHLRGGVPGERWERDGAFGQVLGEDSPRADDDEGTEGGVAGHAEDEFRTRLGHFTDGDPGAEAGGQVYVRGSEFGWVRDAEADAANVGLVVDAGSVGLDGDRVAEPVRGLDSLRQGCGRTGRDRGDAVVTEHGEQAGGRQRAGAEPLRPTRAARGVHGRDAWS